MKTIKQQHIDFMFRTKKIITYHTYYIYRFHNNLTDDEIQNINISWGGNRYSDKKTLSSIYREAVKKGFKKSYSNFYKYRNEYIKDGKLNF